MDSTGMSCIKYLLFFFNLLFAISGIVIFTVGIIIQKMYYELAQFIDEKFFSPPMILISVGVIIFVVAFFGCCGAIQESNFMLITFAVMLFLIFLTEIAGGFAGYIMQKDVDAMLKQRMGNLMLEYNKNVEITKSWNALQHDFKCCGTDSFKDWTKVYSNGTIPYSCCPNIPVEDPCTSDFANNKGCLEVLKDLLKKNSDLVAGFGLGVALAQLVGVIFACCLARSIRKEYETV